MRVGTVRAGRIRVKRGRRGAAVAVAMLVQREPRRALAVGHEHTRLLPIAIRWCWRGAGHEHTRLLPIAIRWQRLGPQPPVAARRRPAPDRVRLVAPARATVYAGAHPPAQRGQQLRLTECRRKGQRLAARARVGGVDSAGPRLVLRLVLRERMAV